MNQISTRNATVEDVSLVLHFIKQLADYEKMLDIVTATEESIKAALFSENPSVFAIFACFENKEVGMALYFFNFSTFTGRHGLYLEDIFVYPEYRKQGVGQALLKQLAIIAQQKKCGRMEWIALKWNESIIRFYRKLGAVTMDEWIGFKLEDDKITALANS